jgi:hypothetical protein
MTIKTLRIFFWTFHRITSFMVSCFCSPDHATLNHKKKHQKYKVYTYNPCFKFDFISFQSNNRFQRFLDLLYLFFIFYNFFLTFFWQNLKPPKLITPHLGLYCFADIETSSKSYTLLSPSNQVSPLSSFIQFL